MDTEEIINLVFVSMVNQSLQKGYDSSHFTNDFEKLPLDSKRLNDYKFVIGERSLSFDEWVAVLKKEGALKAFLMSSEEAEKIAGNDLEQNTFVVTYPGQTTLYSLKVKFPRRTTIEVGDITKFIDTYAGKDRQFFIDQMLWQNEYNLHLTKENDWDKLVSAVNSENIEDFVSAFTDGPAGNAGAPQFTSGRWGQVYSSKIAPQSSPLYSLMQTLVVGKMVHSNVLSIEKSKLQLTQAIQRIVVFAESQKILTDWVNFFRGCLSNTDYFVAKSLEPFFTKDALELVCLLEARSAFGGMGTWSDVGFENNPEYERVSGDLLKAINDAMVSIGEYGNKIN